MADDDDIETDLDRAVRISDAKHATGFITDGSGKRIAADGLISRSGYRRIIPGETTGEQVKRESLTEQLADIGAEIFSGRNATIFEARILNPLRGRPKVPVEDVAAQFGISVKRVYKIEGRCRERAIAALRDPSWGFTTAKDELETWAKSEKCSQCGRWFAETPLPACRGSFANENFDDFRPECLRIQYRTKEFNRRLADLQAAHQQWWGTFYLRHNERWRAEYEALQAELAALGIQNYFPKKDG